MNPKFKEESYQLLGGINQKVSQYQNTIFEFLDIKNYDFQTPNALTQRWGSTQYMEQNFSGPITTLYEFQKLNGASFVFVGVSGGLWFGATTGQNQGVSLSAFSSTFVLGGIKALPYYQSNAQLQIINLVRPIINYKDDPTIQYGSLNGTLYIHPIKFATNIISNVPMVDNSIIANGSAYLRFDGSTFWPMPLINAHVLNVSCGVANDVTMGFGLASFGMFTMYASYVNNRGFESEIFPIFILDLGNPTFSVSLIPGSFGGSFVQAFVDLYTPSSYGISTVNIYSFFGSTTAQDPYVGNGLNIWYQDYVYLRSVAVAGETTRIHLGATISGSSLINLGAMAQNIGAAPNAILRDRLTLGFTPTGFLPDIGSGYHYGNLSPKFISQNHNIMFASGFSGMKSTVFIADRIEPQGYNLENTFEVRTNDGDEITGQVTYKDTTLFFKQRSFHILRGDDVNNFSLAEVSSIYGALNSRVIAVFDDYVAFLDRKGIVVYDGSKPAVISDKVQPIFDRMNFSAAINVAELVHDKVRNQVLCAIPVDNSSVNNITVVFDYVAKAWTTHEGYTPTTFEAIRGRNNDKYVFYGTTQGSVNWFGPSFITDVGTGITLYYKTRFMNSMGESVQKQWRRLFLNADVGSATFVMPINFYQDYGTSKVLQSTFVLSEFQSRYEFGISSKSIAYELYNNQTSSIFRLYGFTMEHRMQRKV